MKEVMGIETISCEEAKEYLKKNTHNRKTTRGNVDFIKKQMIDNAFVLNGQTIVFSDDGKLLDGQHRLIALSELKGHSYKFMVVRGIKESVFTTIDTGKSRNAKDVLSMEGVQYASIISSAIRRILDKFRSDRKTTKNGTIKLSNKEILFYYKENKEELDEIAKRYSLLYVTESKILSPASAIAFYFLLKDENKKIDDFIYEVYSGEKLDGCVSAQTLRKRLINCKIDRKILSEEDLKNLFLSSFRAYYDGKNISKIVNARQFFLTD